MSDRHDGRRRDRNGVDARWEWPVKKNGGRRARATTAPETSDDPNETRSILPSPCRHRCGRTASGDDGPLAECDDCWYARRAAELIVRLTPQQAERILDAMQRLGDAQQG